MKKNEREFIKAELFEYSKTISMADGMDEIQAEEIAQDYIDSLTDEMLKDEYQIMLGIADNE